MTVLIQKRDGEIATANGFAAYLGFRERGRAISFFEPHEFDHLSLTRDTLVVGGVPVVMRALEKLGVTFPSLPSVPESLAGFARREIWRTNLFAVRAAVEGGERVFIKPAANQLKQFPGHVISGFGDLVTTAGIDGDTEVVCAQVLDMRSEYRVYVHHAEALGCKHYWGDFRLFPDFSFIDAAIAAFHDAPAAYAIDFAVLADGSTALIEVNDAFALGSYGLQPMLYARLLEARWEQLMGR
mgnify:CR=1 FL=1